MRISVANAQALVAGLSSAIADAQNAKQSDFDLLDALSSMEDAARDQLSAAIAAAEAPPSNADSAEESPK